jgi:hypothetical protein
LHGLEWVGGAFRPKIAACHPFVVIVMSGP